MFRFDVSDIGVPVGQTVTKLVAVTCVAVTFSTTAVAVEGTPPRPVTWSVTGLTEPTGCCGAPVPLRVSSSRSGLHGADLRAVGTEVSEHVGDADGPRRTRR